MLALPALEASGAATVVARPFLLPLVELAGFRGTMVPVDRGAGGILAAANRLRAARYDRGILLTPSLSSAVVFALGGVAARRGTATDGRRVLLTDAIEAPLPTAQHRASLYHTLVTGEAPVAPPVPHLAIDAASHERWRALAGPHAEGAIGLFPGSNASSRRWASERFAEVARRLAEGGHRVIVFGGPGEEARSRRVAGDVALDLGGRTDLPTLAAGLASCRLVVSNDSGPMHLAAAAGTTVVAIWGAGEPRETGPLGAGHRIVRHASLPCIACRHNVCPRHGPGTYLPDADRECLALVTVDEVLAAVESGLRDNGGR
ncbi:MAG: glycosyltransferase family 9 protein [Gemmatimonadales bacterium]